MYSVIRTFSLKANGFGTRIPAASASWRFLYSFWTQRLTMSRVELGILANLLSPAMYLSLFLNSAEAVR